MSLLPAHHLGIFFGGSLFLDEGGDEHDELQEMVAMISWNYLCGEKNGEGGGKSGGGVCDG